MSTNNTITEFPRTASQPKTITLDEVIQTVSHWRANKKLVVDSRLHGDDMRFIQ
jgi:hypothetical protein